MISRFAVLFSLCVLPLGCAWRSATTIDNTSPPPELLGRFVDDYGIEYSITADLWTQLPTSRYHVNAWNETEQFLIAQNDSSNPGDELLFTRIDWIKLDDMPPYGWAFCLTTYAAQTAEEAREATAPDRANPRTGCGGHPFSRMKRSGD